MSRIIGTRGGPADGELSPCRVRAVVMTADAIGRQRPDLLRFRLGARIRQRGRARARASSGRRACRSSRYPRLSSSRTFSGVDDERLRRRGPCSGALRRTASRRCTGRGVALLASGCVSQDHGGAEHRQDLDELIDADDAGLGRDVRDAEPGSGPSSVPAGPVSGRVACDEHSEHAASRRWTGGAKPRSIRAPDLGFVPRFPGPHDISCAAWAP